jgi:amino acid permease
MCVADGSSRGFAMGWDYAIAWLTVLPFELIAASITIEFWRTDINMGVWVAVFLTLLCIIQLFGVRGYGEGELPIFPRRQPLVTDQCIQSNSFCQL